MSNSYRQYDNDIQYTNQCVYVCVTVKHNFLYILGGVCVFGLCVAL